jgi:crotonobetainyl-CoA hydratase
MSGLKLERRGAVLELTLDRPKANAIDDALSRALGHAFIEFRDDPKLRVAIVTGAGDRFFSAGWDLKAAAAESAADGFAPEDYGPGGFAGLTQLFDLDKPVIAAINGLAVGGGFELALACDLIVSAEHAEFFAPESKIGLIPDAGGIFRLPRRIPEAIALEMMLTGRRMGAAEAYRLGLLNRVVPQGDAMAAARQLAVEILATAPLSALAIKQVHRLTRHLTVEEGYAKLAAGAIPAYEKLKSSSDYLEGARAFAEKREPVWKGE